MQRTNHLSGRENDLVHFYYVLRRQILHESVSAKDRRVNEGDGAVTRAVTRHFLGLSLLQLYLQVEECT